VTTAAIEGVGIHSGSRCRVRLHRDDGALRFRVGRVSIVANVSAVVATPRCTVLGADGAQLAMVEHLLAALRVAGFWSGVVIEADGPELPILDGSAAPWAAIIAALGPAPLPPSGWAPTAPLAFQHGSSWFRLEPGDEALHVEIDFAHPHIGRQRWCGTPDAYAQVLSSRTFATEAEVIAARAAGGLRGAAEGRGIVFGGEGPRPHLRSADEPARHKALDALGDLTLLGYPLAGRLTIERGSHAAHVAFMEHLRTLAPAASAPVAT